MRQCGSCGLLFNSPRLDDRELAQLYGRNYYFFSRSDARELSRIVPMYQRTVGLVANDTAEKRSLDVGCGRGYLPAVLRALGWDAHGVELSPEAADHARSRFGCDVSAGTIEQYAASERSATFPLVSAIDVIEHVPSPRSFVAAISHVVETDGHIILDTPNAAARNIETRGLQWGGFNPFHIFLFTIENLSSLLEQHGMVVERSFSYNNQAVNRSLRDRATHTLKRLGLIRPAARMYFAL
jgi:2-polyprenyl-3-methyl-5-hydroxy-6-metoxy-1,4-benzoquinol methylase